MSTLRALIEDVDVRKQWIGYFLIATTLDVHSVAVFSATQIGSGQKEVNAALSPLNKHLNAMYAQICTTIAKNELLGSDISTIAIKAWTALVQVMHQ